MSEPSAASGTKLWLGTTAANGATDTYILIGSLESLSEYGVEFSEITFEDLSEGVVKKLKGPRNDGTVAAGIGMDMSDAGQLALLAALDSPHDHNAKITFNDANPAQSATATITIASPGVVTWTAHGFKVGTKVKFSTTGALPTGLTANTEYYVKTVLDADTFTLSATNGGSAINTSGTQSGTHTATTVPTATADVFKAKVMGFKKNPGNLSSVIKAAVGLAVKSGSLATAPRLP